MKRLLDAKDPLSIKRFATLISLAFFIVASFTSLYVVCYAIFYTIKGKVDADLLKFMEHILYYDFMIIAGGLGLIGVENFGQAMIERSKAIASSIKGPTVKTDNIENVNVDNPDK